MHKVGTNKKANKGPKNNARGHFLSQNEHRPSRAHISQIGEEDLITPSSYDPTTSSLEEEEQHKKLRRREPTPSPSPSATRTNKTGSRRRSGVTTVWEGWILPSTEGPSRGGRPPQFRWQPPRDNIITLEMSDPNLTNNSYRSQEDFIHNVRTSEWPEIDPG